MKLFRPRNQDFETVSVPPGYKLQTDGEKFRFVNLETGCESGAYDTPGYAAALAWHVFKTLRETEMRKDQWKDL